MARQTTKRLYELDALRGIATLFVVFYHFTMQRPQSNAFWDLGIIAVDIFFMISGFVITMSLERCRNSKEFILNRAARLYPSYWVCMTLTTMVLIAYGFEHINRPTFVKYIANLTMLHVYLGQESMDGVYWSLLTEICFYVFMFLIFRARKLEKIEPIIMGSLLVLSVIGIRAHFYPLSALSYKRLYTYGTIVLMLPNLLAGVCFYRLAYKGKSTKHYLLIAACFVTAVCMRRLDPRVPLVGSLRFFSMLAGAYGIFFLFINGHLRFIVNRITLFFGKISYPLYLIHMNISLLVVLPNFNLFMSFWQALFATFAVMIVVAALVHWLVEIPAMELVKKKWLTQKTKAIEPQVAEITLLK